MLALRAEPTSDAQPIGKIPDEPGASGSKLSSRYDAGIVIDTPRQNRIYLYVLCPDGELGAFQWIASANGFLPSLWQVLLSAEECGADVQRVLGSDLHGWTAVAAQAALTRYGRFVDFLRQHPQFDQVDGLERYLEGARQYLAQMLADWQASGRAAPVLCANLTQLQTTDPSDARAPVDRVAQLHEFRDELGRIMRADDYGGIERLLRFPSRNLRFADWKAWSGMFGLAQFEPRYFSAAFRQPFSGDYVDHDYDEFGSDPELGNRCYRYKVGDRWGVRRVEGDRELPVLQPEWDRILRSGAGDRSLVWIRRGGRFGLAAIAGQQSGCVLRAPDLDEVNGFVDGVAIVRSGARMGLLSMDGSWHLEPCMDQVYAAADGRAVVQRHGGFGYIDAQAKVVIEPVFDEADDFTPAGVARVRRGDRCGLIHRDGSVALPLQFAHLEWSDDFAGWLCRRDGSVYLTRADGSTWIDAGWDAIEVFVRGHLMRVRRGTRYGLLRWSGENALPCEFDELLTRDTRGAGAVSAQGRRSQVRTVRPRRLPLHRFADERPVPVPVQVVARRAGRVGVLSEAGVQLLPFEFSYIDAIEPHIESGARLVKPELMRVLSVPGKAAPRVGVWDLAQRCCLVPCEYDFVWLTLFDAAGNYGFIVGNRNPKRGYSPKGRYRVGLLRSDGSVLVPQDYAWIGECTPLNRDDAMNDLRSTLYYYWSRGEPVRASVNENGPMVGVRPPVTAELEVLVAPR